MTKPFEFVPEDFDSCSLHFGQMTLVVDKANAKLREWLESAQTVVADLNEPRGMEHAAMWASHVNRATHKARLVNIELIHPKD